MGFATKFKKKTNLEVTQDVVELDGILREESTDEEFIVYLSGKLDVVSSEGVKESIIDSLSSRETGKAVVLDAEKVTYVSSAGMRMFFEVKKTCDANGTTIEVRNIQPSVYKILQSAGYSAVMNLRMIEQ